MTLTETDPTNLPWGDWLAGWDRQQAGYLPEREERFDTMLDVVAAACPDGPVVLDLAAGPGSISQRLLARMPAARAIAVDWDPVLLTMGRNALAGEDRIRWIEADLRSPGWVDHLGGRPVDAVVSTTALHWFTRAEIATLYAQLARVLRPGGVFLNGDHLDFGPEQPRLESITKQLRADIAERAVSRWDEPWEDWQAWWDRMAAEAGDVLPFAERERRFAHRHDRAHRDDPASDCATHHDALVAAGFAEVGVVWQRMDNRILAGIR